MELLTLGDEVAARLAAGIANGAWSFAASRDPEATERLRGIVEAAGLLNE